MGTNRLIEDERPDLAGAIEGFKQRLQQYFPGEEFPEIMVTDAPGLASYERGSAGEGGLFGTERIYINREFLNSLSPQAACFAILHEYVHDAMEDSGQGNKKERESRADQIAGAIAPGLIPYAIRDIMQPRVDQDASPNHPEWSERIDRLNKIYEMRNTPGALQELLNNLIRNPNNFDHLVTQQDIPMDRDMQQALASAQHVLGDTIALAGPIENIEAGNNVTPLSIAAQRDNNPAISI